MIADKHKKRTWMGRAILSCHGMRRSEFRGLPLLALMLALTGCSVGMAAAGDDQPDLVVAQSGTKKEAIDAEFGFPTKIAVNEDGGAKCRYVFVLGDEPSYSRAVLHAGLDVMTIGLWEAAATPIEKAIEETQQYEMTVVYDKQAVARSVQITPMGSGRSE